MKTKLEKYKNLEILLILFLQIILYHNVAQFDFVWDDAFLIQNNPYFNHPFHFLQIFGSGFWELSSLENPVPYYRPLVSLLYVVQHKVFGFFAGGYHLVNLAFHLLNITLVWILAKRFGLNRLGSFICSVIFSLHPTQVHTVCFISSQGDILCAFFSLLTILFWTSEKKIKWLSLLWISAALMFKEAAAILPIVLLGHDVILKKKSIRDLKNWIPFLILIPYFILRTYGLKNIQPYQANSPWIWDSMGGFRIFLFIGRILFPIPYPPEITVPEISAASRLLFHAAFLILIGVIFLKTKSNPKLRFFCIWFFLTLLLVADWFDYHLRFSDQLLYIPLISLSYICGLAVHRNKKLLYVFIFMSAFYVYFSNSQIGTWKNNVRLWSSALDHDPTNPTFSLNFAVSLLNNGFQKDGCDWMEYARKMNIEKNDPNLFRLIYFNLGNCNLYEQPLVAEDFFRLALRYDEHYFPAQYNLIQALLNQKKNKEAYEQARNLIEKEPNRVNSWEIWSYILKMNGDLKGSREATKRAEQLRLLNSK